MGRSEIFARGNNGLCTLYLDYGRLDWLCVILDIEYEENRLEYRIGFARDCGAGGGDIPSAIYWSDG